MKLCVTYTERFKKHFKKLSEIEKKQFRNKLAGHHDVLNSY